MESVQPPAGAWHGEAFGSSLLDDIRDRSLGTSCASPEAPLPVLPTWQVAPEHASCLVLFGHGEKRPASWESGSCPQPPGGPAWERGASNFREPSPLLPMDPGGPHPRPCQPSSRASSQHAAYRVVTGFDYGIFIYFFLLSIKFLRVHGGKLGKQRVTKRTQLLLPPWQVGFVWGGGALCLPFPCPSLQGGLLDFVFWAVNGVLNVFSHILNVLGPFLVPWLLLLLLY